MSCNCCFIWPNIDLSALSCHKARHACSGTAIDKCSTVRTSYRCLHRAVWPLCDLDGATKWVAKVEHMITDADDFNLCRRDVRSRGQLCSRTMIRSDLKLRYSKSDRKVAKVGWVQLIAMLLTFISVELLRACLTWVTQRLLMHNNTSLRLIS